jgi:type IV secretory pathway TrbL component
MLARVFCFSHNTQMLGIKYAYLMINFLMKIILSFLIIIFLIKFFDYEEEIKEK